MTRLKLSLDVLHKLRSMPYDTYLRSMCGIISQYQILYQGQLWERASALIEETLALTGTAINSGREASAETAGDLLERWTAWLDLDGDGPPPGNQIPGLLNAFFTCCSMAAELAGVVEPYEGSDRCTMPFTDHPAIRHPGPDIDPKDPLDQMLFRVRDLTPDTEQKLQRANLGSARLIIFGDLGSEVPHT